jgi:hypothetical protein
MRRILLVAIAAALLLIMPTLGKTENASHDGNYLLRSCQITVRMLNDPHSRLDIYESWRDGRCRGLVEGVSDASPEVCADESVTLQQEYRVVLKFLEDHPEKLNMRDSALVRDALAQAFPCKR